jgi:hypothetical protein
LFPQQATELSDFSPHVKPPPVETETKLPAGGVALPSSLVPQQATEPSVFTPQV